MKYLLFLFITSALFAFYSCNDDEAIVAAPIPDCLQSRIDNDDLNYPFCRTNIERYIFQGETVFLMRCMGVADAGQTIINTECDTICRISSWVGNECNGAADFYEEASDRTIVYEGP